METAAAAVHQRDELAGAVGVERGELVDVGAADKGAVAGPVTMTRRNSGSASSAFTASTISSISSRFSELSFAALSIVSRAR